jgi:hypothetical protein
MIGARISAASRGASPGNEPEFPGEALRAAETQRRGEVEVIV